MSDRVWRNITRKALITGITGQDGSYLSEFLLSRGYEVHGLVRRVALEDPTRHLTRISHIHDRLHLHAASLESYASLFRAVQAIQPDECYHLAAQSFVSYSFDDEFSTINTNISGTHFILSSIKEAAPNCRFYFAASSEMFGKVVETPQNESTPFYPRSPYGISKVSGFYLTRNYREAYNLFACNGILFNHESERRGYEFVTRKVSSAVARIYHGLDHELELGNLAAQRDWGYSPDYVEAMWLMLQQPQPDDYVIATGETHSVQELVELAFQVAGLDWSKYVVTNPAFYRPAEVQTLCGDSSKARRILGWQPKVGFEELVQRMVKHDINNIQEHPTTSKPK